MDEKYTEFTPVIRLAGALAPSGSGTFPVARACDILMPDNSRLDEYLKKFDGDSGIGANTVLKINDTPDLTSLSLGTEYPMAFASNGVTYAGIGIRSVGSSSWGIYSLNYFAGDHTNVVVFTNNPNGNYGIAHGWSNEAYKTITINEAISDETLLAWLKANATLISSGGSGLPPYTDADNGKFLQLVDGSPSWVLIEDGDEVEY